MGQFSLPVSEIGLRLVLDFRGVTEEAGESSASVEFSRLRKERVTETKHKLPYDSFVNTSSKRLTIFI